ASRRSRHRYRSPRRPVHGEGQHDGARSRSRVQRRAWHLPAGAIRHAARRHRGRHRRRAAAVERGAARSRRRRVKLDLGTCRPQWARGGLLFLWVTTRRREVGLGYGWLLRGVFGAFAIGAAAVFAARGNDAHPTANALALAGSIAVVLATGVAL